ncbi:MAG: DUF6430 domain-containing protein [Halanaerobiales bacterium]|nr:DUF6430 domain-containing protein [Halanaerobiales bacterium]
MKGGIMLNKINIGIKRDTKKAFLSIIFSYTFLWSIIEPSIRFLNFNVVGIWKYLVLLLCSIIVGLYRVFPKDEIQFFLKNTNTKIKIKFGDVFEEDTNIAIAVNEFFDSKIGKPVSPKSLHGIIIKEILGNKKEIFDKAVKEELKNKEYIKVNRKIGKIKKYDIGTTVPLKFRDQKYFLFALSKTDENHKAYSNAKLLLKSLDGLWRKTRVESNGMPLSIPLVGTGLSGIGLPPMQIIELILISILSASKKQEITSEIKLVISPVFFEKVNLNLINQYWGESNGL